MIYNRSENINSMKLTLIEEFFSICFIKLVWKHFKHPFSAINYRAMGVEPLFRCVNRWFLFAIFISASSTCSIEMFDQPSTHPHRLGYLSHDMLDLSGGILYRNWWSYIDNCWLSCQFHQLGYNLCIIQWFHGVLRLAATTVSFCRLHGLVDFSATLSIVVGDNIDSSCYFCWRQVTIFGAIDVCCCTLVRFLIDD